MESDIYEHFVPSLCRVAPFIVHPAENVRILDTPSQFYSYVLERVVNAKRQITISTLYIGTDSILGMAVVNAIIRRLELESKNTGTCLFRVNIVVDGQRSSRRADTTEHPPSLRILESLQQRFPQNVSICGFFSDTLDDGGNSSEENCAGAFGGSPRDIRAHKRPSLVTGIVKRLNGRLNEVFASLMHMKYYVFDDDVLLSGANLSDQYFSNRQDRYIIIEKCPLLSAFYAGLTGLLFKNNISEIKSFIRQHYENIGNVEKKNVPLDGHSVVVFPTVQIGSLGIRQDEVFTLTLLHLMKTFSYKNECHLHLSTAYFNMAPAFRKILSREYFPLSVYVSSPRANSFWNSRGASSLIPDMYSCLGRRFLADSPATKMCEYYRDGEWTFHSKGLFLQLSSPEHQKICLTQIGSSNYGKK